MPAESTDLSAILLDAALRDALLPKLLSGELRVHKAAAG
jgi:hypothetical protein